MKDRLLKIGLLLIWTSSNGFYADAASGQVTVPFRRSPIVRLPAVESEPDVDSTMAAPRPHPPAARDSSSPGSLHRVAVRVTANTGVSVYLDKGRGENIQPGDEVVLYPPTSGIVNAIVQSISRSSARCSLISTGARIDVGTRGDVLIPEDRLDEPSEQHEEPGNARIKHPAWSAPPEDWDQSRPLLAPAYSRSMSERDPELRGRLFAGYLHTRNRSAGDNQYSLGRVGTALWIENPLSKGGTLQLRGEVNRRGILLSDAIGDVDGPGRLDRISYRWGGNYDQPLHVQVGRFLPQEFVEFGLVDGAELGCRTDGGHQIGVIAGFLPEPFPNLNTGDDFQVSTYCRFFGGVDQDFSTAIGYQKTWHKGSPDRDQLICTFSYAPAGRFSMFGSVWGDFYDASDTLKTESFEVSQALGQAAYCFNSASGVGATYQFVRWPQLLRREFSPFLRQQIVNGQVERYGAHAWQQLGNHLRLDGRIDQWSDQSEQTGTSWEGSVSLGNWLYPQTEVACAAYGTHGVHSSGPGGRVSLYMYFSGCVASLSYDATHYRLQSLGGRFLQQYVRSSFDVAFGSRNSVTLLADYSFGEHQNALQLGMFLQKRI